MGWGKRKIPKSVLGNKDPKDMTPKEFEAQNARVAKYIESELAKEVVAEAEKAKDDNGKNNK